MLAHPLCKIRPAGVWEPSWDLGGSVSAAQNEYESFQVVVFGGDDGVTVSGIAITPPPERPEPGYFTEEELTVLVVDLSVSERCARRCDALHQARTAIDRTSMSHGPRVKLSRAAPRSCFTRSA